MVDGIWSKPAFSATQCQKQVEFLGGRMECGIYQSELSGESC